MKKKGKIKMGKMLSLLGLLSILSLWAVPSEAMQLKLDLEEIIQSSDLIYIGTVEKQNSRLNEKGLIVTDVYFTDLEIVHAEPVSLQKKETEFRFTYAGGEVDGMELMVSDMPTFKNGHRYFLCVWDDGKAYINPLVGASQGLFEVLQDTTSNEEFVVTADRKAIVGVNREGVQTRNERVLQIQDGEIIAETAFKRSSDNFLASRAVSADPADSVSETDVMREKSDEDISPLALEEFIEYIDSALKMPLKTTRIKREGQGNFYRRQNGEIKVEPLENTYVPDILGLEEYDAEEAEPVFTEAGDMLSFGMSYAENMANKGATLYTCGYHDLPLIMQQVPSTWWNYSINAESMEIWNRFMKIYTPVANDGSYGDNNQNEFVGWIDNSTLNSKYLNSWGPAGIALCFTRSYGSCGEIIQSDIMWNRAYSWTSDADYAMENSGVILIDPVTMHELGHSWGYQREKYLETYDYDKPTVMHKYYSNIVENGKGIHSPDAYFVRRNYDDQTAIINITDVGVESYYASDGLINSTTNKTTYYPGDSITLSNITVENMSNSEVKNVRMRIFLSKNRTISTSDYQIGSYWYWDTFCAECYSRETITTTIPNDIPAGSYYVGAMVTVNGYNDDDYNANNTTSFYRSITIKTP